MAQVTTEHNELMKLIAECPAEIPQTLKVCSLINPGRVFPRKLQDHSKFNDQQVWVLDRKRDTKSATCSGCLAKAAINQGDLHLCVKGLFYIERDNQVVESTMRFECKANCVRFIKGTKHNIRDMSSDMMVICGDELKNSLSDAEKEQLYSQGFEFN